MIQSENSGILSYYRRSEKPRYVVGVFSRKSLAKLFAIGIQRPEISFVNCRVAQFTQCETNAFLTSVIAQQNEGHALRIVAEFRHQIGDIVSSSRAHQIDITHLLLRDSITLRGTRHKLEKSGGADFVSETGLVFRLDHWKINSDNNWDSPCFKRPSDFREVRGRSGIDQF